MEQNNKKPQYKRGYNIKGMHCRACELMLENSISKIAGVGKVNVNHKRGTAEVEFADGPVADELVAQAVKEAGYSLGNADKLPFFTRNGENYFEIIFGLALLMVLYFFTNITGILDVFNIKFSASPTYSVVFLIGLTAGVSTCMALIGGLVAGFSASYAEKHQYATRWERFSPNLYFNAGRLASYALLGGIIGAFGSVISLSTGTTGLLVIVAGFLMLYIGLKLTDISPKLSNLNISLPKKLSQKLGISNSNGDYSHKEAAVAGALTFFLPCGFTQAMQIYAITTGSFILGATIMFLFALGTAPGLLGIGAITSALKGKVARIFFRFVGVAVIALGIFNISNGAALSGIEIPFPSFGLSGGNAATQNVRMENGEQVVNMTQFGNGYSPNVFEIKKDLPVKWIIDSQNQYTCAASIRMPAFGIAQSLNEGKNIIRFTPTQTGNVRFTCGMGMYSGIFKVVE